MMTTCEHCGMAENSICLRHNNQYQPIKGLHIEGRRWFDRKNGNTYHSVRIFGNGNQMATLPYQYGYGDQWLQTALDWLREQGMIEPQQYYANGSGKFYGTLYLRESLGGTYSVIDVTRKGDL